ncbi:MAG TPA: S26 family signal peptidase [Pirellulales bacterium]|nr:S26 family signal peptidase [Pirellulales bacterium]
MSLASLIVLLVAALVESFVVGTLLFYIAAQWWKTPQTSLRRAAGLCAALLATSVVVPVLAWLLLWTSKGTDVTAIVVLMLCFAGLLIQWNWVRIILRTNGRRAAAVFLSASVPLVLVNTALTTATRVLFAEGFIVPTGAMAPTIIGAHAKRACANCGCGFNVSLSAWVARHNNAAEPRREEIITNCPNCRERHVVDVKAETIRGDRILCDKTTPTERWSLAVFVNPRDRDENYVKRVVGLPGEAVGITGGEVFINGKLLRKGPQVAADLWLPLNDTALVAKELRDDTPRWRPREKTSGWREQGGRWSRNAAGDGPDRLDFTGGITDFVAYNDHTPTNGYLDEHHVGDVLVSCEIADLSGSGKLGFEWRFGGASIIAELQSDGHVAMEAKGVAQWDGPNRGRAAGRLDRSLKPGDTLGFAVRDGQAYVLHNNYVAALATFEPDYFESSASIETSDFRCRIAIAASDCSIDLRRITVHRDVYYVDSEIGFEPFYGEPSQPLVLAAGECFMLGDNSARSVDSRFFGGVPTEDILGVVRWIYWPPSRWHELQ